MLATPYLRINLTEQALLNQLQGAYALMYLHDHGHPTLVCLPVLALQQTASQLGEHTLYIHQRQASGVYVSELLKGTCFSDALQTLWQHKWRDTPSEGVALSFDGGLLGNIAYPAQVGPANTLELAPPVSLIGEYMSYCRYNPVQACWYLHAHNSNELAMWLQLLHSKQVAYTLAQPLPPEVIVSVIQNPVSALPDDTDADQPIAVLLTEQQYTQAFDKIQGYLAAGDCYQVNYTHPFIGRSTRPLVGAFATMQALTQAPFLSYLSVGPPTDPLQHELLSCSPELFISFGSNGSIVTRPIKGTRKRSSDSLQDAQAKEWLHHSEKDRAENVMIVDLLRNDLSKHAESGSVKTTQLCAVETFAHVHHMVSEVRANRAANASSLDVLLAAFPGGSITGAPKLRAMQVIDELELGNRGGYCGSIGYINYNQMGRFNIAIRTFERHGTHVQIWAGGGITVASEAALEWQESIDKVHALITAFNDWMVKQKGQGL